MPEDKDSKSEKPKEDEVKKPPRRPETGKTFRNRGVEVKKGSR